MNLTQYLNVNCCSKEEEDLAQAVHRISLVQCCFNMSETSLTSGAPETHTKQSSQTASVRGINFNIHQVQHMHLGPVYSVARGCS